MIVFPELNTTLKFFVFAAFRTKQAQNVNQAGNHGVVDRHARLDPRGIHRPLSNCRYVRAKEKSEIPSFVEIWNCFACILFSYYDLIPDDGHLYVRRETPTYDRANWKRWGA